MLIKPRKKSISHLILESLYYRKILSFQDKKRYENQVKGFNGEQQFDHFINHSQQQGFIVNDLFLSSKETNYQFDSILILNKQVNIYEVKNYTGVYRYEDGALFSKTGYSLQDPISQVNRKKSYLHNRLLTEGYPHKMNAYVVFINPDFYIYNLPPTDSILFAGQLERHFNEGTRFTQSMDAQDKNLTQSLVNQHNGNYRPDNLPSYHFKELKKGILCGNCFSFHSTDTRQTRICASCGYKEKITDAIYRSMLEFQMLFPEIPITVSAIYAWCGGGYSKKRIKYVLKANMTCHNKGPKSYYS